MKPMSYSANGRVRQYPFRAWCSRATLDGQGRLKALPSTVDQSAVAVGQRIRTQLVACVTLLLSIVACSPTDNGAKPPPRCSEQGYDLEHSQLREASLRLHATDRLFIEPYKTESRRWELQDDEVKAVKALVSTQNLRRGRRDYGKQAISYWIVAGDDRWGVYHDGLFFYNGDRNLRYSHDDLDLHSPGPLDKLAPFNAENMEQGLANLVKLYRAGKFEG